MKTKWIMKQYWRISAIRAWMSLAIGMLSISRLYYVYIPGLEEQGFIGALILGCGLIFLFMGIGWLYDEKGRQWRFTIQALQERGIYRFIPNPRAYVMDYPFFYTLLTNLKSVFTRIGLDSKSIDDLMQYMEAYYRLTPDKKSLMSSKKAAKEFQDSHPFIKKEVQQEQKIGIRPRLMLGYEVQVLRISWVRQITGLVEDAFVVTAIYIIYIFPEAVVNGQVSLEYMILGFFIIALPVFTAVVAIGWVYDRKLTVWAPHSAVAVERNPYSYLMEPRMYSMILPAFFTLLNTLRDVSARHGLDTQPIEDILQYLEAYGNLSVVEDKDMANARKLRKEFGSIFEVAKRGGLNEN